MLRLLVAMLALLPAAAQARMLCTVVADASSGEIVREDGDCRTRVTPASTFKIPLAIMGFEDGFLKGAREPVLTIRPGEWDWNPEWKEATDPERWLKYSVVWYSQRITAAMGAKRFAALTKAFGYGNADVSGDRGKENGLTRSWIGSSLEISPVEQVAFLQRFLAGRLPVKTSTVTQTRAIVEVTRIPGWTVQGKTGSALPRKPDGTLDRMRGWGWFVGWASDGKRTYVFARLDQDEKKESEPGGVRAKAKLLDAWPELAKTLAR